MHVLKLFKSKLTKNTRILFPRRKNNINLCEYTNSKLRKNGLHN